MDKYILVNVNMFAHESKVFVSDHENLNLITSHTIEELPKVISQLAHEHDIYTVKICGGGKYSHLIEYGIESAEIAKYSENKIKVEVI